MSKKFLCISILSFVLLTSCATSKNSVSQEPIEIIKTRKMTDKEKVAFKKIFPALDPNEIGIIPDEEAAKIRGGPCPNGFDMLYQRILIGRPSMRDSFYPRWLFYH